MGTIKLEIDIPEFEKELNINVTIHRDGEVLYSTSSPSVGNTEKRLEKDDIKKSEKLVDEPSSVPISPGNSNNQPVKYGPKSRKPSSGLGVGGNLMGLDF